MNKHSSPDLRATRIAGGVATDQRHDSAHKHVSGTAVYIDDMPEPAGTLYGALILSQVAAGRLRALDLSAVMAARDVVAVIGPSDIPGRNDVAPVGQGEPLFAVDQVSYAGQPLALVVARTLDAARHAAELATIDIEPAEPVLDVETALARKDYVQAPSTLVRGNPDHALETAPHRLSSEFTVGGQEHFYLEGQIAFALPGEDGDIVVHSSTQHPTEVQHICARLLGCDFNRVTAVVRRLGGGFGGKESNASWVAGAAALAAHHTGHPVKLRLPREIDMIATGKRHPFLYRYTVGFDDGGRVLALDAMLHDFERDWSSVQMEWEFIPELCIMTHGALSTTNRVLSMLAVHPERMLSNLHMSGGQLLAERVMFALAERTGRQKAHDIVHEISMGAVNNGTPFSDALKRHPAVSSQLGVGEIERLLDPTTYVGLSVEFVDKVLAAVPAPTTPPDRRSVFEEPVR